MKIQQFSWQDLVSNSSSEQHSSPLWLTSRAVSLGSTKNLHHSLYKSVFCRSWLLPHLLICHTGRHMALAHYCFVASKFMHGSPCHTTCKLLFVKAVGHRCFFCLCASIGKGTMQRWSLSHAPLHFCS